MMVSIHQPMYLPWNGYFDKMKQCDLFVILDDVPYSRNYFINRNRIRIKDGWIWLTVPVLSSGRFGQMINKVEVDNSRNWQSKHWKSICHSYEKSPCFNKHRPFFEKFYSTKRSLLMDTMMEPIRHIATALDVQTPIILASYLEVFGKKGERLLEICKKLDADSYLSGPSGKDYLDIPRWEEAGIKVYFHEYDDGYNLSAIDTIFNGGKL